MPHTTFTFAQLEKIVSRRTKSTVIKSGSGRMLFTEYGARLLGMFPDAALPNVLWNPNDLAVQIDQKTWCIGGDRLWLSPERAFYYENPRDFEGHHVPASMDPGAYRQTAALAYTSRFSILNTITNESYDGCMAQRVFKPIADPYRSKLAYAGVRITDTMALGVAGFPMCAWNLTMVYTCCPEKTGTALFPVKKGAAFLSYFNRIPPHRAENMDGYVRFRIDAGEIYKLAIQPEDMVFSNTCKAVYLSPYPRGSKWFCVIKRSDDMPRTQADCVDTAKGNPNGPKGAIQSYNSGPTPLVYLPFGEIELQLKKGKTKGGKTVSSGTHELLSYAGSKTEMLALAQKALGITTVPDIY